MQRILQTSPEVAAQHAPPLGLQQPDQGMAAAGAGNMAAAEEAEAGLEPPQWLVQGLGIVAERSQGSRDGVQGAGLLGRK